MKYQSQENQLTSPLSFDTITIRKVFLQIAALAQSVARRLGKAEVGGSSPLGSLSMLSFWESIFLLTALLHYYIL